MTTPTVSVVMAAYNGAALVAETLASLSAQTFSDFEVLVVDDRSTDSTREVVAAWPDPRVRLIALEANGGPVRARNRGVAEARGRYIAALDQDDLCRPERFARQVAWLETHPDCALLGTQVDWLDGARVGPSRYAPVTTPALVAWLTWIENPLAWSSVMIRADAARALDPFTRPEMLYAEDFDLYHRIQALGEVARLDVPLLAYRRHDGGASQRFTQTMEASATRVLAEAHAGTLGDAAPAVARLLVVHLMRGDAVPDRPALIALGGALATLQSTFLATRQPNAESRRLIKWETARRWAGIGRAGLRAGTLTLADVMAVRPDHLGLGHAGLDDLVWSRMIGGARGLRRAG
ncbi:glycosyltransferase family 2 protein [Sphingomonas sp.]|uniref:glycosyltransferase family 2 protein n=1 Tax=Sphingomonas sp. TaxID=28214 RepID=UPI0035BC5FAF